MSKSLIERYEEKYGSVDSRRGLRDELRKVTVIEYEEATCKASSCVGCKVVDDCLDAVKYAKNYYKERVENKLTHIQLMEKNKERFGEAKPRFRKHWRDILGEYISDFIKLTNNPSLLGKLPIEGQDFYHNIRDNLMYHGWVLPKVENKKLSFVSSRPIQKNQDDPKEDFIPEVEELVPDEVQEVLF